MGSLTCRRPILSENTVWMWAGLLPGAINVMLQSLTGPDREAHTPGRMRIAALRHRLRAVPGRLISHARGLTLRLADASCVEKYASARSAV